MRHASTIDAHPSIEAFLVEGYRRMSPTQKLARVAALTRTAQDFRLPTFVDAPNGSVQEQNLRLASRWLEPDLMRKAFGWDPDKSGF